MIIVEIIFCNPLKLLTNLSSLETLNTLTTLAICGPTRRALLADPPRLFIIMSNTEAHTTNKSN